MSNDRVTQLGTLGLEVSNLARWEKFATGILGLECRDRDPDGTVFLRMDEHHHRFSLRQGPRDDIDCAGWLAPDEAALRAIAERVGAQGAAVRWGTATEARQRRVAAFIGMRDPSGVAIEVGCGPLVASERPFRSPRDIPGFEASDLGLGHIVLAVDDYDASLRFYRDGLGLRISDYIDFDMGGSHVTRAAFLHCGPRHHSLALVQVAAAKRMHHFMLQLRSLHDVGTTLDLCRDAAVPITMELGCHTNDRMVSFYAQTPSGFHVEVGHGGVQIDDDVWQVQTYQAASTWGHRPPAVPSALPAAVSRVEVQPQAKERMMSTENQVRVVDHNRLP
jgi:2,3-dihydroxybiphenyl 1,2-dioxygenase